MAFRKPKGIGPVQLVIIAAVNSTYQLTLWECQFVKKIAYASELIEELINEKTVEQEGEKI